MVAGLNSINVRSPRVMLMVSYAILLLTPVVITVVLLQLIHGVNIVELMPAGPDDLFYWREAGAFARVGFASGYTSPAEYLPPASFSRFGPWGPVSTLIYGAFATIRWPYYGVPLVNIVLLTLAAGFLLILTRPNFWRTLALSALVATFSANIIHGPTSMQVILQQALAVGAAGGLVYLLNHRAAASVTFKIGLAVLLAVMSLSKVTWAALWIPYFVLISHKITRRSLFLNAVVSTILALAAALLYRWLAAPYPYSIASAQAGWQAAIETVWRTVITNLGSFNTGHPLEIHMRWLTVGLIILMFAIIYRRRRVGLDSLNMSSAIIAFTLGITLIMTVALYEVQYFRDFRVLASVVFMASVMIVLTERRSIAIVVILAQFAAVPWAIDYYATSTALHVSERIDRQVDRWKPPLAQHVEYMANAPSPWCNTVLISPVYIFDRVGVAIALDERVSVSLLTLEGKFSLPVKSRYVLLDNNLLNLIGYQMRLEPLLDIPEGKLYLNLDADCLID